MASTAHSTADAAAAAATAPPPVAPGAAAQEPVPVAPMRGPREHFTCRVAVQDLCVNVDSGDGEKKKLMWEQLRINCDYNGVMQRTRWLATSLSLAEAVRKKNEALKLDEERAKAAGVPKEDPAQKTTRDQVIDVLTERILPLPFTSLNDTSFIVEFTSIDGQDDQQTNQVRAKKVHMMHFSVDACNDDRIFSTTGGSGGEVKPTSSNKEAMHAAVHKGAAVMSGWARNAFRKLTRDDDSQKKSDVAAQQAALTEFTAIADKGKGDDVNICPKGIYATVVNGVDLSEAYNSPGGRKRIHLMLKKEDHHLPSKGEGVPIFVSFTLVVMYNEAKPVVVPRNFHNFAVLVDQMVLNLTEARSEAPAEETGGGGFFSSNKTEDAKPPRSIVGYGFGLTSNVFHTHQCQARSFIVALESMQTHEGTPVRVIDFPSLHRSSDEHQLNEEDYKRLPTSCCVVSSGCKVGSKERIGSRVVCVSRFKTSPEGLCKPSKKCQLVFSLFRRFASGEEVEESAMSSAINLATILNDETYPSRIREIHFSLGEILYVRLRRFCFVDPIINGAPLLMPYDLDNTGVEVSATKTAVTKWNEKHVDPNNAKKTASPSTSDSDSDNALPSADNDSRDQRSPSAAAAVPAAAAGKAAAAEAPASAHAPAPVAPPVPENPFLRDEHSDAVMDSDDEKPKATLSPVAPEAPALPTNPFAEESHTTFHPTPEKPTVELEGDPLFSFQHEQAAPQMTADAPAVEVSGMENFFNKFETPTPETNTQAPAHELYNFGGAETNPGFELSEMKDN